MPERIYNVRYYTLAGAVDCLRTSLPSALELADWHEGASNPFRQHPDYKPPEVTELTVVATERVR